MNKLRFINTTGKQAESQQTYIVDQLTVQLMPHPPLSPKRRTAGSVLLTALYIYKFPVEIHIRSKHQHRPYLYLVPAAGNIHPGFISVRPNSTDMTAGHFSFSLATLLRQTSVSPNFSVFSILSHQGHCSQEQYVY